jgi:hypothetical protein
MQSPHRRRDPVCTCRPCSTAPQHRPTDYSRTAFLFGERASPCSALVVGRHGHSQQSGPADAAMRVCALQQVQVSDSEPLLTTLEAIYSARSYQLQVDAWLDGLRLGPCMHCAPTSGGGVWLVLYLSLPAGGGAEGISGGAPNRAPDNHCPADRHPHMPTRSTPLSLTFLPQDQLLSCKISLAYRGIWEHGHAS